MLNVTCFQLMKSDTVIGKFSIQYQTTNEFKFCTLTLIVLNIQYASFYMPTITLFKNITRFTSAGIKIAFFFFNLLATGRIR